MKKQYATLAALMLAIGFCMMSCNDNANKPTGDLEFDNIRMTESVHLFGDTAKPGSRLIIDCVYVKKANTEDLKNFVNAEFMTLCLDDRFAKLEPQEALRRYADIYTTGYRTDLEPLFLEDQRVNNREDERATAASWYDYYQNIESHIHLYQSDLLVFCADINEYTGGAHGMERRLYINMDVRQKEVLNLDDIFVEEYEDILTELLWQELMRSNKVTTREELETMGYGLMNDLTPSPNFYLDVDAITFVYNVYELAPYSMGAIEIKLPFEAISGLLQNRKVINDLRLQ